MRTRRMDEWYQQKKTGCTLARSKDHARPADCETLYMHFSQIQAKQKADLRLALTDK